MAGRNDGAVGNEERSPYIKSNIELETDALFAEIDRLKALPASADDDREVNVLRVRIFELNRGLAISYAQRTSRFSDSADFREQCVSAATEGLWVAIGRFRPEKGAFPPFARTQMMRRSTEVVRQLFHPELSEHYFGERREVQAALKRLQDRNLDREPTAEEIAEESGVPLEKVKWLDNLRVESGLLDDESLEGYLSDALVDPFSSKVWNPETSYFNKVDSSLAAMAVRVRLARNDPDELERIRKEWRSKLDRLGYSRSTVDLLLHRGALEAESPAEFDLIVQGLERGDVDVLDPGKRSWTLWATFAEVAFVESRGSAQVWFERLERFRAENPSVDRRLREVQDRVLAKWRAGEYDEPGDEPTRAPSPADDGGRSNESGPLS